MINWEMGGARGGGKLKDFENLSRQAWNGCKWWGFQMWFRHLLPATIFLFCNLHSQISVVCYLWSSCASPPRGDFETFSATHECAIPASPIIQHRIAQHAPFLTCSTPFRPTARPGPAPADLCYACELMLA